MSPSHNAEATLIHCSFYINTTAFAITFNMACKPLLFGGAGEEGLGEGWEALGGRGKIYRNHWNKAQTVTFRKDVAGWHLFRQPVGRVMHVPRLCHWWVH